MDSIQIKTAATVYPVNELIRKRWSARSFSDKNISINDLKTILEAAGWAASAINEQPWFYYYAFKGTEGFNTILNGLAAGNQPWAKNAAVLIATAAKKTLDSNHKENGWAAHDLGMANGQLLLQAVSMNIYGHPMAGFDKEKLTDDLNLPTNHDLLCVIALGYLDEADKLEEPFKTREKTPRQRKSVDEISKRL